MKRQTDKRDPNPARNWPFKKSTPESARYRRLRKGFLDDLPPNATNAQKAMAETLAAAHVKAETAETSAESTKAMNSLRRLHEDFIANIHSPNADDLSSRQEQWQKIIDDLNAQIPPDCVCLDEHSPEFLRLHGCQEREANRVEPEPSLPPKKKKSGRKRLSG